MPLNIHPVNQQPHISPTPAPKSSPAILDGSTFPAADPDPFAQWSTDWSLDWVSSNIQFSGSDILEVNPFAQGGVCQGIPLEEKIDFFDGLEKVGIEETPPSLRCDSILQPLPTIQPSSPSYGSGLEITSSLAKELDIAGNCFRFRYLYH